VHEDAPLFSDGLRSEHIVTFNCDQNTSSRLTVIRTHRHV